MAGFGRRSRSPGAVRTRPRGSPRAALRAATAGPTPPGATLSGSCTDNAGNSSSGSFIVKYDTHPPATTAAPTRAPNAAGWFRTPVTISASGTDSLSGVDSCGTDHLQRPRHDGDEHERDVHRQRRQQLLRRLPRQVRRDAAGGLGSQRRTGARQQRLVQPSGSHRLARNRCHLRRCLVLVAHLHRPGRRERVQVGRLYRCRREQQRQLLLLRAPVRLDASRNAGHSDPGAEREGLAPFTGHCRLERFGHDLGNRLVQLGERLQRARHRRRDPRRQLHRQRRQQLERQLHRQVRHAPAGDDRCADTGPERRRVVPRARDDLRQRRPTRSPASTPVARPRTAAPTRPEPARA